MAGSKRSKNTESVEETIRKILSKYDKILRSNLKKYDLSDLHGLFVTVSLLMSICFGIWISLHFSNDGLGFYASTVVFSFISGIIVFPVIASVLVHPYKSLFSTSEMIKTVLAYQSLTLFIAMVLSLAIKSPIPIQFGLFIFAVLIFVHPMIGILYKKKSDVSDFNKIIQRVYTIFTAIINILNFVINHGSILKLVTG